MPVGVTGFAVLFPLGGLVVMVKPIFPDSFGNNFESTSAFRFVPDESFRLDSGMESSLLLLSSASDSMASFLCFLPLALTSAGEKNTDWMLETRNNEKCVQGVSNQHTKVNICTQQRVADQSNDSEYYSNDLNTATMILNTTAVI